MCMSELSRVRRKKSPGRLSRVTAVRATGTSAVGYSTRDCQRSVAGRFAQA